MTTIVKAEVSELFHAIRLTFPNDNIQTLNYGSQTIDEIKADIAAGNLDEFEHEEQDAAETAAFEAVVGDTLTTVFEA